jgi:hypothetical protein
MKRIFISLFVLSFFIGLSCSSAMAQRYLAPGQRKKIETRVKRLTPAERKASLIALNAKLGRLNQNLRFAKGARRRTLLAEVERVEIEIGLIKSYEVVVVAPPPGPPIIPPGHLKKQPIVVIPEPAQELESELSPESEDMRSPQVGLSAGFIAGIPAAQAEIRFHNLFDLLRTTLRIGAAYAEGEDTDGVNRKHALVSMDGIYRLNPPHTQGIRSYFGLGINYDAYTTGRESGSIGGGAFYGIEGGPSLYGQLFFEIGYGTIRTGFSPNYNGITALLGYKF